MSLRRMMMFTLGGVNLVAQIINNLKSFIATITVKNGVTFEAEACTSADLTDLQNQNLLSTANFILIPNNSSEAKTLPTLPVPTDNTRNLLFRSEGSTATWSTTQVTAIATSSIVDPVGTQRVVRLTEVAATNNHTFQQSIPNLYGYQGDVYSFSTYLKKGDGAGAPDIMQLSYGNGYGNFNINTGTATASGSVFGASMQNAGSGWWRCIISGSFTGTSVTNNPLAYIGFANNSPSASLRPSYTGVTNRNVFVYGSQFELSLTASAYQPAPVHPRLPSGFASFFSATPGNYWVNSSGSLQNTPYENIIYPSIRISSVATGTTWRWIDVGLSRTITGNADPNGTFGASRINLGAGTSRPDYFLSHQTAGNSGVASSFPTSKIRTLILYVKQDSTDRYLGIKLANGGNTGEYNNNAVTIKVDCSNGTLANNPTNYTITYTSQSIGNGWYKVCINRADAWDSMLFQSSAALNTVNNTPSAGVLIWGVQVLNGVYDINTPTYQRELGYSIPRLDYSGSSCPDYLIERSAFNTLIRSEEFASSSIWITSSMTVTTNSEIAPNSDLVADTLTAIAVTASIKQSGTANAGLTTPRIFSVYLKRKTGTGDVYVNMGTSGVTASLSTGSWTRNFVVDSTLTGTYSASVGNYTVSSSTPHRYGTGDAIYFDATSGTGADASISSITVTGTNTFTFTNGAITSNGNCTVYSNTGRIIISASGDEVYAWGAQIESSNTTTTAAGRVPSTYMPTTTAQVTRAADVMVTNFSGSISSSIYFELSKIGGGGSNTTNYLVLGNETGHSIATDSIGFANTTNGGILFSKKENNGSVTTVNTLPYTPTENKKFKTLITTSGSSVNVWVDGSLLSTTTFANPNNLRYITLDNTSANTSMRLSKVISWPTTLSRQSIDLLFAYPYYNAGYTPVNSELQQIINRAYAEGFTLPSTTTLGYCDTLITNVKNEGMWNISDVFFNFAYNDTNLSNFARINWKNPYGGLGLASYAGSTVYELNGIRITNTNTGYVDTNFNPSIASFNYTLNNACRLSIISAREGGFYIDGVSGNVQNQIQSGFNSNGIARINAGSNNTGTNLTINAQTGLTGIVRYDSTNITVIQQNVVQNTTQTSTALFNSNQFISRGTNFSFLTHAFYYMGSSVTNTQVQNLRTHYNTFLTSLGLSAIA